MGKNPWVIPRIGKVANINIRLIIAYTAIEDSPPKENKILFTKSTVTLTIACRARVTDPNEEISLINKGFKLKALKVGCKLVFFERKK